MTTHLRRYTGLFPVNKDIH